MLCSTLAKRSRSRLQTDGLPGHCAGLQSPLAMLRGRTALSWALFYKQMVLFVSSVIN